MILINRHWCFLEGTESSAGKIVTEDLRSLFLPYSGNMGVEPVLIWVVSPPEIKEGS